jgi:branched-chain amino acid transport system permease protein
VEILGPLVLFGTILCLYVAISLTLNLEFGLAGIPNFGKVLFISAGGMLGASVMYRLALYIFKLNSNDIFEASDTFTNIINRHLVTNPLLSGELALVMIVVGASTAGVLGYLSSYPAIRLREDYLGMLLLGSGELFSTITAYYMPIVGGPENLTVPDVLVGFGSLERYIVLLTFALFAAAVFIYSESVLKSPLGRTLKAVRDNEIASEMLGKDNVNIRRKILITSSILSGIAGALWVIYWSEVGGLIGGDVASTFPRLLYTFYPFTIVILGGVASNYGVILGSMALTSVYVLTTESLPSLVANVRISWIDPNLLNNFINSLQYIIIGVLLIVMLFVRPEGLIRERPAFTMPKAKLKQIADSLASGSSTKEDK